MSRSVKKTKKVMGTTMRARMQSACATAVHADRNLARRHLYRLHAGSLTSGAAPGAEAPPLEEVLPAKVEDLVAQAVAGDRFAIGVIAIAFGPMMIEEARTALKGSGREDDAADVVQELLVALLEGGMRFPQIDGAGEEWLKGAARCAAEACETRGGSADARQPPPS